jgi:hypothetical protein
MPHPLDPRICNISLDANALDQDGSPRDDLVEAFRQFSSDGTLNVVMAGGARDEVLHPSTPASVQATILPKVYNLQPGLSSVERARRASVEAILQGKARPGKHAADASHLCEAAETGCGLFITHDKRVLDKRVDLKTVLPPSLTIVTLEEFFKILDGYVARDAARLEAKRG